MIPNIVNFYRASYQRGQPFVEKVAWTSQGCPTLTIESLSNQYKFVDEIRFLLTDDFSFQESDTLRIDGWTDGKEGTYTEFAGWDEIVAVGDSRSIMRMVTDTLMKYYTLSVVRLKPPKLISAGLGLQLVISKTGSLPISGELWISVRGWKISADESDTYLPG